MTTGSEAWSIIANIASTTGITTAACSGVVAGYQAYNSAFNSLAESERKLKKVESRLRGLSEERRKEIERATQSESSDCISLQSLEAQLEALMDTHCRLSNRFDAVSFSERHNPFSEFRKYVSKFESDARVLLNDTLTTTVPHINDMGFNPKIPKRTIAIERPSISSVESSEVYFTTALSSDANVMSMSRIGTIV